MDNMVLWIAAVGCCVVNSLLLILVAVILLIWRKTKNRGESTIPAEVKPQQAEETHSHRRLPTSEITAEPQLGIKRDKGAIGSHTRQDGEMSSTDMPESQVDEEKESPPLIDLPLPRTDLAARESSEHQTALVSNMMLDENIPLKVLQLSVRAYNCLRRAGIDTVVQVVPLSDEGLLAIRNVGVDTLAEIKQKLDDYLDEHPEYRVLLSVEKSKEPQPPQPPPRTPLVDSELLARAAQVPLNDISIERLALPEIEVDHLLCQGIRSIGDLVQESPEACLDDSFVIKHLTRYLDWIVTQDESAWEDEVAGEGISPLHGLLLSETTLDKLTEEWLGLLSERERKVLRGRLGHNGSELTLKAIGQRMEVTRERVRQIQQKALDKLSTPKARLPIASLIVSLVQVFVDAGGLMTEDEIREGLTNLVSVGDIDSAWAATLLLRACGEFQEITTSHLWGLADRPLDLVPSINEKLTEFLSDAGRPIPSDQLISRLTTTPFSWKHDVDLDGPFVVACLRTHQRISVTDGICILDQGLPKQQEPVVSPPEQQKRLPIVLDKPPDTLEEWEHYLSAQVGQVELLGEIPISDQERSQLGKVIGLRVRTLGHGRALKLLKFRYPSALIVYLVAQGVYGYQGGDYWTDVIQVTGLNRARASQVGQVFEEILEALGLRMFYDMRADALRYVSLILAHGGIPNYCLPDFFAKMLQPSVLHTRYADMSTAELIAEWQWRTENKSILVDRPITRFLFYGEQVAEDFVERCREMAWEYLNAGMMPDADDIGLPKRVVDAYGQWIAEQSTDQVQRETADRWRLRKPAVLIDPWGEGVILNLPPQQAPATTIYADVTWQVTADEEMHSIPVRVRRTGFDRKTEAESLPLKPAETYKVSLLVDGQIKRTWRYQGVSDRRPLLVFDPERGALLSWSHSLPARRLGLLYPARLDLQVEGEGQLLEELPRLPWGWATFQGRVWDFAQATRLTLMRAGEAVWSATLRPDESLQRPHLVGGELFSLEEPGVRAPVYIGPPPAVRVPLTGRRELKEELAHWRLTVRNTWSAIPERRVTTTLADLQPQLTVGEKYVDLPLSLPSLLGESPCGNFVVQLRGPLGRDAEFTLRMAPHLVICGHETLYLPDAQSGPQPVTLLVETLPGDSLECQSEREGCRVQAVAQEENHWEHEVVVEPDMTEVELTVVRPLPSGDAVRVPVRVPIRRLRWALVGEQIGASRGVWTGHIIKRPVDALLQMQSPFLLIRLPLCDAERVHLKLRLLDAERTELQVMNLDSPIRGQQLWRFDLTAFLDTIRASRSPIIHWELVVWNLPERGEPLRLPVLSLTRTLVVKDVELAYRLVQDRVVLELKWHEPVPLKNRHVRFWPLWRPWDPVLEHAIPDDAEGMWSVSVPSNAFRSGKVRLEFLVVDPWVSSAASERPPSGTLGTVDIEIIPPHRWLQSLDDILQKTGPSYEVCLERASIYHDMGDSQKAHLDLQWCYNHLDDGTIPQILTLVDLMQATENQATVRALQLKMFAAHRVERLLNQLGKDQVSMEHFRAYLAHLPRSGLLPETTCKHLLSLDNETVRLHAVQQLIRRGAALGIETILEWVDAAKLSEADAVALLSLNPNFARECLQEQAHRPAVRRLLEALGEEVEDVIRVGDWVHCSLGKGCIEQIEDVDTCAQVNWCAGQRSHYRLIITLRSREVVETVTLDLASGSAKFLHPGLVRVCTECEVFSTQNKDNLIRHFEEVHPPRTKKEAKNRGRKFVKYYREEETSIPLRFLEFSSEEPPDQ